MTIGYVMNTYPLPSTTFVRREIQALERRGYHIHRFAMRADPKPLADPQDVAEAAKTEHLLRRGVAALIPTALAWMIRRPPRAIAALRLAMTCGARGSGGAPGTGGRLRHLVYLIEAAHLAYRCHTLGIRHVHAHFGTNATAVAMLSRTMDGPSYSFTTHGPEEFDAPRALALDLKIQRAAFVAAISSFGKSQLSRWVDATIWPRLAVVHCGIEPWKFPDPAPPQAGPPRLVAIGRLSEQKGFALLLDALALARDKVPDLHVELVGDGPLRDSLMAQAKALGVTDLVTFAGWKAEPEVRASLAAAQALILPSFAEGLPMVIMEAFAAGRTVLATSIAGIPELVTPDTGWLVPAGDADRLAAAIADMARTPPDRLAEMGHAARARVLARHDIDIEAAKLDVLFKAVEAKVSR
jgi:colanic acid/amylovoran biosynthesis glycosyltransferase